jgi:hypothetical protein
LWSLDRYSLPPASSQAFNPFKAFSCCPDAIRLEVASAMALFPSAVRGPVLNPP